MCYHFLRSTVHLQKHSSTLICKSVSQSFKEIWLPKSKSIIQRKLLKGNILLGSFVGLCFNKTSPDRNQSAKEMRFETGNFNPHWHFFLHLWKITPQRDERFLYPTKGNALNSLPVHFPIWRKLSVSAWIIFSATKVKVLLPLKGKALAFGSYFLVRLFVSWMQCLIVLKDVRLVLLVFICIAEAIGTLGIKLPYCASWEFYSSQPTPSSKLYF